MIRCVFMVTAGRGVVEACSGSALSFNRKYLKKHHA